VKPNFIHTLSEDQQRAASRIDFAHQVLWHAHMMRAASLEPRIGGVKGEWGARVSALIDAYGFWLDEMHRRRMPVEWVIAMVVDGMAPGEVDWRARQPEGWGCERLIKALDLYCELQARQRG
jgi:hypothetical protein